MNVNHHVGNLIVVIKNSFGKIMILQYPSKLYRIEVQVNKRLKDIKTFANQFELFFP
jgi:hypothetical protein